MCAPSSMSPSKPNESSSYGPLDVLCGRGGKVNRHSGNRVYRRLVDAKKPLYNQLIRKEDRIILMKSIVRALKSEGVRFVKLHGDQWLEISDEEAMNKTSQAFREPQKKRSASTTTTTEAPVDAAAIGMLRMANKRRRREPRKSSKKKDDLLNDDWTGTVSTPVRMSTGTTEPEFLRRSKASFSGCHSFPQSSSAVLPPALQEQESQAVSDFMKGVADKPAPTSRRQMNKQESQEVLGLLKSISLGKVPITQSPFGTDFLRYMRSVSLGNRAAAPDDDDSKPAAATRSRQPDSTLSSTVSPTGPADFIFSSEQERQEFVGLMKEISIGTTSATPAVSVLQNWEEKPLEQPLPKQESLDLFARLLRLMPDVNSTATNHAAI